MGNIEATGQSPPQSVSEMEDDNESEDFDSDTEFKDEFDLSPAFHCDTVCRLASQSRHSEKKVSLFEECYSELKEALERLENRTDLTTIAFTQFSDMLSSKGLSNEELLEIFERLDYEGRGAFEVVPVLKSLKKHKKISLGDDLYDVARRFQEFSWIPGFVDVYIDQKEDFKQHSMNILEYLLRNRLPSSDLRCDQIVSFEKVMSLRDRVVNGMLERSSSFSGVENVTKKNGSSDDRLSLGDEDNTFNEMTADKVIALWNIQILTLSARASLASNPLLLDMALQHSRKSISHLMPLSLSHDSRQRPSFLTAEYLSEMSSFIELFPEREEVLELLLSFHLSTGFVYEIFQCLTEISALAKVVDYSKLLNKIQNVRQQFLKNESRLVKLNFLVCDCDEDAKNNPNSVTELHWNQDAFSTKTGQRQATFVFETSEWVEFSKIKIKVANGNCGSKSGLIFVLSEWPLGEGSCMTEELEKFSLYDAWRKPKFSMLALSKTARKRCLDKEPVAFFCTENCDEVDVDLESSVVGKYLMVKFLEPRDPGVDHLEVVGVKCFGIPRTLSHALLEKQLNDRLYNCDALQSNQSTVQSILCFLMFILSYQNPKTVKDGYYFSTAIRVFVDQKTGLAKFNGKNKSDIGLLVAKCPFKNESSYFEIEIDQMKNPGVTIGAVSTHHSSKTLPGQKNDSYGYCAETGIIFLSVVCMEDNPTSGRGDRIGCGVRFNGHKIKSVYFTKNGKEIFSQIISSTGSLYPAIGFEDSGNQVRLLDKRTWRHKDSSFVEKEPSLQNTASCEFVNPKHLDLLKLTVESIWDLHKAFSDQLSQSFILQLLHSALPWSVSDVIRLKNADEIFRRLCEILDQKKENVEDSLAMAAKDLILNGIHLFCPSKDNRLKILYELLDSSNLDGSKLVILQSLCHHFSVAEMDVLMVLPSSPVQDLNFSSFLSTMEKLISISFQRSSSLVKPANDGVQPGKPSCYGEHILSGGKKPEHQLYLTKLFNQLQIRLFGWIGVHLQDPSETEEVEKLLLHYCSHLVGSKVEDLLLRMKMLKDSDVEQFLLELDTSILGTTFPELVLLLSQFSSKLSSQSKINLLDTLKTCLITIHRILLKVPELSSVNAGDAKDDSEVELRSWKVEFLHDRPNLLEPVKIFTCPEATIFEVIFGKDCGSRYTSDYLEFSDSTGNAKTCSGAFNTPEFPPSLKFENTTYLRFEYFPDASNFSFDYKFTVYARKAAVTKYHWLYDLYLNLCRLFGRFSGCLLDKSPVFPKSNTSEDKIEAEMYRSKLWATIFRGGLVLKKFERSLSGNYETDNQSDVADLVYQICDLSSEKAKAFFERCKKDKDPSHNLGGEEIDRAVRSVFAALLWHTQSLRHDISIYLRNELDGKISDGIHEAYAAAEKLRLILISRRQNQRKEEEEAREAGVEENKTVVDEVSLAEDKAKFLLQFAGLSKVAAKAEESKRRHDSRHSRYLSLSHCLSRESTVDLEIHGETSKHPSFRLVFEFVQDTAWSCEKVKELLKRRYNFCENLWKTYFLVCECLRTISDGHCNRLPCKVFLQELMATQRKFGRHYADELDGCGLAMEANVRRSYYDLLRLMVSVLRKADNKCKDSEYVIIAAYTNHLLDISWQAYDFPFLAELRLPELYFSLARDFVSAVKERQPLHGVDETQEEYERNLAWVSQATADIGSFREEHCGGDHAQLAKYILAKYQKSSYMCDGCSTHVSEKYYRCLNCNDVDLCRECFENENIPSSGLHCAEHELIYFEYRCSGCKGFITGTRWHCKECQHFDLCNGCYKANHFPAESDHASTHGVTSFQTTKVTQDYRKFIENPLEFYVYQHSWMLFVALCYGILDFLMSGVPEQKVDDSYLFAARQLLVMCYNQALDYLISFLDSDTVDSAIVHPLVVRRDAGRTETEVAVSGNESPRKKSLLVPETIGLLASLVSTKMKIPANKDVSEVLASERFLFTLFDIARADTVIEVQTRLMALGLIHKLLQQMDISSQASESITSAEDGGVMIVDKKALRMVQSLFDFGADCLEKHNFELAKAASEMLYSLHKNPTWTKLLSHRFLEIVNFREKDPEMSSVFALFAFTGFPEMLTVGTLVNVKNVDKEVTQGIIESNNLTEKNEKMSVVVELSSRQTKKVNDILLEAVVNDFSLVTENQISLFFTFVTHAIGQMNAGVEFGTKAMWILALTIKAIMKSIRLNGYEKNQTFYAHPFLSCISYLASMGTDLPKALLLRDLEILSLEVNRSPEKQRDSAEEPAPNSPAAETQDCEGSSSSSSSSEEEEEDDEFRPHQLMMFMTQDQADEYRRMQNAGRRQRKEVNAQTVKANSDVDKGVTTAPNLSDVLSAEIEIEDCITESKLEKQELISSNDEIAEKKMMLRKDASKRLMKEQLKNVSNSEFPFKVVRALAIRYARRLLMAIISEWPKDVDPFSAECIGCGNITDVFFILHLLNDSEDDKSLEKIVERMIGYCTSGDIATIASASGFFIGASNGQAVTITRQIPRQTGKDNAVASDVDGKTTFTDEVHIPGATTLSIKFENRFCSESEFELKFSSTSDFSENVHCFASNSADDWSDFNISGDRLYSVLKVSETTSSSQCKFKVLGILSLPDNFDIGYMALNVIMDKPDFVRSLPFESIWKQLIFVANNSEKTKRLKMIRLLLKMLSLQTKNTGREEPSVDLTCLKGLWKMYKQLVNDNVNETVKPALVLALTELFFVAENVAQEWNIAETFATSLENDMPSVTQDEEKSPNI